MATTLGSVLIEGLFSSMPPAGSLGRIFFATDTKKHYYDNGTSWDNITSVPANFVGDSGSGGAAGAVPAPAAGDAAAGKFLSANGSFEVPPASTLSNFTEEVVTFSGTSGALPHTPTVLIGLFKNGVRLSTLATGAGGFSISGAAVTLGVAAGGSDVFIAVYFHA